MKKVILIILILFIQQLWSLPIKAQSHFIPKIGWIIPLSPPSLDSLVYDSQQGIIIGLEFRSGNKTVYFNPGLQLIYNKVNILKSSKIPLEQDISLQKTRMVWLETKIGTAVDLYRNDYMDLHMRGGLVPGFLVIRPDFGNLEYLDNNYRNVSIELQLGAGFGFGNITVDMDIHIQLVRKIRYSDIVENSFGFTLGYIL